MNKSIFLILILFVLQLAVSCASYHNDRVPSSTEDETEQFYKRNPRLRR